MMERELKIIIKEHMGAIVTVDGEPIKGLRHLKFEMGVDQVPVLEVETIFCPEVTR